MSENTRRIVTHDFVQRLKSALWFSVGKIVDEETLKLGVNATPQFIGALTEMVWAQIGMPKTLIGWRVLQSDVFHQ